MTQKTSGGHTPKPNTQFLSWFYGEHKKGTLRLNPKYQRNPIWSIGQKCFLMDSIISGCPIPQVYINIFSEKKGKERETIYEVVDGQQRLRAILEFMSDEWSLIATTVKSYPVSDLYKPYIGKKYSELPDVAQEAVWNYPLAVQELRDWEDVEIRQLFRRLNYVVEKLNKQELRHSQYFGEFVTAVEQLAELEFWNNTRLFTRRDFQRMKDIEFVSELFIIVIDGVQEQQKTLDQFYAQYDVVFPRKSKFIAKFKQVVESISTISDVFQATRFSKKADFYGLFAAAARLNERSSTAIDLSPAKQALIDLSERVDGPGKSDADWKYYFTVIEGANKLSKRKTRSEVVYEVLKHSLGETNN